MDKLTEILEKGRKKNCWFWE